MLNVEQWAEIRRLHAIENRSASMRSDLQIIALLQQDARQSARSIAKAVRRSPGAVLERIGRLEREGVIRGYVGLIDLSRLGIGMAAIVGLQVEHDLALLEITERLLQVPECEVVSRVMYAMHVASVAGRG